MLDEQTYKRLVQQIHIAKQQLMLSEEAYRALLIAETGKNSCKQMEVTELETVLIALRKQGFTSKTFKSYKKGKPFMRQSERLYLNKLEAMILDNDLSWDYVEGICRRAFKKDGVRLLKAEQLHKLIQMLAVFLHNKKKMKQEKRYLSD